MFDGQLEVDIDDVVLQHHPIAKVEVRALASAADSISGHAPIHPTRIPSGCGVVSL